MPRRAQLPSIAVFLLALAACGSGGQSDGGPQCAVLGSSGPTLDGGVELDSDEAWASFAHGGYATVAGDLTVTIQAGSTLTSLRLPNLGSAGAIQIFMFQPQPIQVDFPALTAAGPIFVYGNVGSLRIPGLGSTASLSVSGPAQFVDLCSLIAVSELTIDSEALPSLALPSLASANRLELRGSALSRVALPALRTAASVLLLDEPALTEVTLPQLTRAGAIVVHDAPVLTTLGAPALSRIDDRLELTNGGPLHLELPALQQVGVLSIGGDASLQSIAFPSLTTASTFDVFGNAALTSLEAGALRTVTEEFDVEANPALAQCQVDALRAQLTSAPHRSIAQNNDGGTTGCP